MEIGFTLLRIVFVALLCVPVIILSFFLFSRLTDEFIRINREKKEKKERQRLAEEQRRRRRGL